MVNFKPLKNVMIIFIFTFILLINMSLAYASAEDDVKLAVENYYFAFISENMDSYLDTQIIEHLDEQTLEERKNIINSMWLSFDTSFRADEFTSITIDDEVAIASYILGSTITETETGEQFSYELEFTALLFLTENGWKVFRAMPSVQFNLDTMFDMLEEQEAVTEIYSKGQTEETLEDELIKEEIISQMDTKIKCEPTFEKIKDLDVQMPDITGIGMILSEGDTLKIIIDDDLFYVKVEQGKIKSVAKQEKFQYTATLDSCTYERIIMTDDFKTEYDKGNIKIKSESFDVGLILGKIVLGIYNFFSSSPETIWVEAESGILQSTPGYSFIGATSRGPGELYLAEKDATATYTFNSDNSGQYYLYVRVSDDALHKDGARSVIFTLNQKDYFYNHKSVNYIAPNKFWGWEQIGLVDLVKGENVVVIAKPERTSAAFVMDKFVLSQESVDLS